MSNPSGSLASDSFWPEIWGDLVKISRGEQRTEKTIFFFNFEQWWKAFCKRKKIKCDFLLFQLYPHPASTSWAVALMDTACKSQIFTHECFQILRKFDLIGKLRIFPNQGIQKMQIHWKAAGIRSSSSTCSILGS